MTGRYRAILDPLVQVHRLILDIEGAGIPNTLAVIGKPVAMPSSCEVLSRVKQCR